MPLAYLVSGDSSAIFELKNTDTVVGRGPECDIIIDTSRSINPIHAKIVISLNRNRFAELIDNSLNGTFVNSVRIKESKYRIKSGDVLRFGYDKMNYRFYFPEGLPRGLVPEEDLSESESIGQPEQIPIQSMRAAGLSSAELDRQRRGSIGAMYDGNYPTSLSSQFKRGSQLGYDRDNSPSSFSRSRRSDLDSAALGKSIHSNYDSTPPRSRSANTIAHNKPISDFAPPRSSSASTLSDKRKLHPSYFPDHHPSPGPSPPKELLTSTARLADTRWPTSSMNRYDADEPSLQERRRDRDRSRRRTVGSSVSVADEIIYDDSQRDKLYGVTEEAARIVESAENEEPDERNRGSGRHRPGSAPLLRSAHIGHESDEYYMGSKSSIFHSNNIPLGSATERSNSADTRRIVTTGPLNVYVDESGNLKGATTSASSTNIENTSTRSIDLLSGEKPSNLSITAIGPVTVHHNHGPSGAEAPSVMEATSTKTDPEIKPPEYLFAELNNSIANELGSPSGELGPQSVLRKSNLPAPSPVSLPLESLMQTASFQKGINQAKNDRFNAMEAHRQVEDRVRMLLVDTANESSGDSSLRPKFGSISVLKSNKMSIPHAIANLRDVARMRRDGEALPSLAEPPTVLEVAEALRKLESGITTALHVAPTHSLTQEPPVSDSFPRNVNGAGGAGVVEATVRQLFSSASSSSSESSSESDDLSTSEYTSSDDSSYRHQRRRHRKKAHRRQSREASPPSDRNVKFPSEVPFPLPPLPGRSHAKGTSASETPSFSAAVLGKAAGSGSFSDIYSKEVEKAPMQPPTQSGAGSQVDVLEGPNGAVRVRVRDEKGREHWVNAPRGTQVRISPPRPSTLDKEAHPGQHTIEKEVNGTIRGDERITRGTLGEWEQRMHEWTQGVQRSQQAMAQELQQLKSSSKSRTKSKSKSRYNSRSRSSSHKSLKKQIEADVLLKMTQLKLLENLSAQAPTNTQSYPFLNGPRSGNTSGLFSSSFANNTTTNLYHPTGQAGYYGYPSLKSIRTGQLVSDMLQEK